MSVSLNTNFGVVKLELFCDSAPKASKNFLGLCAAGIYNNTIFHRNIAKFMIQGGDPTGSGKGGTSIYGGAFSDEVSDQYLHDRRGMLAMANKGPNSNLSQFYITYDKAPHLNHSNTVFGRVIDGFEVLDAMERVAVDEKNRPKREIKILSVKIHANPFAEQEKE